MEVIRTRQVQMLRDMVQIVKQYPPYPLGDKERIELLMRVVGIRKELAELGYPPGEKLRKLSPRSGMPELVGAIRELMGRVPD